MKRALVALVVACSACSTASTPSANPGVTQAATAPVSAAPAEDLARLLFSETPIGYVVVGEETRALTIDDVVEGADDPEAERARLEQHGFMRGYIRTWSSDDDSQNVVYAFVYEFATAAGAAADERSGIDEARSEGDRFFSVPGVRGATGFERKPKPGTEGDQDVFFAAVFVRANRYYLVTIGGPTPHSAAEVIALARRMNAHAR